MEEAEIKRAIEAILFAAGDPVGVDRMALATVQAGIRSRRI